MRTISKRTQYGLKAVIALGRRYGEGPVLIATLSTEETIPLKFLEGILLDLKGRGVLESKKGKGGGYQLSRPPSTITIGSIIRLLEGPARPAALRQRDRVQALRRVPATSNIAARESSCARCATPSPMCWTRPRWPI